MGGPGAASSVEGGSVAVAGTWEAAASLVAGPSGAASVPASAVVASDPAVYSGSSLGEGVFTYNY